MFTTLSWIKEYVPELECGAQEYCDALTLSGTKVECFRDLGRKLEKIYVGEILSIERHPDADKLIVCQVNMGNETLQIVTGASNVNVGDKVPVVVDGGRVAASAHGGDVPAEGIVIKNGKLRGVESYGMMCSIEEMGWGCDMYPEAPENGIYIFPKDTPVGVDAVEVLGLRDVFVEYEVTSNRVDCYSVLGIAREAAATFRKPFIAPKVEVKENSENINDYIKVVVEDTDLCPRYCARVCKNVKIGPSPLWLQRRLAKVGIRPINNLVDITNYVMEEYGQPMHAFDLSTIEGNTIIVKRAKDGDVFQTLDEQERTLDSEMLMINDANKAIGIAGIMGGENSKIPEEEGKVITVLFEAAAFNGPNIRKSAKRLGLRTDASGKFEKGVDPYNAEAAINRACQLVQECCEGAEVVGGMADVSVELPKLRRIAFEPERINALLGTDVSVEEMKEIFARIELELDEATQELIIPSFRQDLEGFADIAEEVARFYGYDKIPVSLPKGEATAGKLSYKLRIEQKAREIAEFCGFSQGMTYSFESPKVFDKLLLPADAPERNAITISNPLGEDFSIMRTISLNGMLTSLATNFNRRNKNVKLYEQGNIYVAKSLPLTEYPEERMQMTFGSYGEGDFFSMKGVIETFFEAVGMKEKVEYDPNAGKSFLHPGRQATISYKGTLVGYLGEVHPMVCANYDMKGKVYVAVLDMPAVLPFTTYDRKYEGIAKFPAVTRDISMVVPKNILAGDIEKMLSQRGGKILESYRLFDIYEGEQIEAGFKSMAYTLTFRDKTKTLQEDEVAGAMKKIMNGLTSLGIELRK